MKVYSCKISGDELFTDAKKIKEDENFYIVEGNNVSRSSGIDESKIGANASAEGDGGDEGVDDGATTGIDLVIDNYYTETGFGKKKEYMVYMKTYIAELQEKLAPADEAEFKASITSAFKQAVAMFDDLTFYQTPSMEGMIPLCKWEVPEGQTDDKPYFYYYKLGVKEEKV